MPVINISKKIGDTLFALLKGTGDVIANTVDVTKDTTSRTIQSIRGGRAEASRIASQGIMAAIKTGFEAGAEIGSVTKGAVIGAIQGVGEVTNITPTILSDATRAAVKESKLLGEDVSVVARKAVEGAIEAGKQAGLKAEDAASAAASGAIEAASEFGDAVAGTVAKSLSGTISGVRMVFQIPLKKQAILIVNGNRRDLAIMKQQLRKEGYQAYTASTSKELDKAVQTSEGNISAALVDITDFDKDIWDECAKLKKMKIPFLILSPKRSSAVQQESVKSGACCVLTKPLGAKELIEHIRSLLGN